MLNETILTFASVISYIDIDLLYSSLEDALAYRLIAVCILVLDCKAIESWINYITEVNFLDLERTAYFVLCLKNCLLCMLYRK